MQPLVFVLAEAGGGGAELANLDSAYNKSYGEVDLAKGGSASFSLDAGHPDSRRVIAMAHDIKVYIGHELVDRLRVCVDELDGDNSSSHTYSCFSYKQMLQRKMLYASDVATTTGYTAIDVEEAGWNLINTVQARDSGFGATSYNITRDGTLTGRVLTSIKVFPAGQSVSDALDDMTQTETTAGADDGWEWDILAEGDDLVYHAWSPRRGKTPFHLGGDNPATYYFDNRSSVISYKGTLADMATYANQITVQGSSGVSEVQEVNLATPISGTFTLTFRGATTTAIAWNAAPSAVQSALEALSTIGSGNVTVSGATKVSTDPFSVRFTGELNFINHPVMTLNAGSLGGSSGAGISTLVNGSRYTKVVTSDDAFDVPYGIINKYELDKDLTDQLAIDERANYLLRVMSVITPKFDFVVDSSAFTGPSDFWIGDYVIVDLIDEGVSIYQTNLRVFGVRLVAGDDGDTDINVSVMLPEYIDRTETNLQKRIARAEANTKILLAELKKLKAAYDKKITALKKNGLTRGEKATQKRLTAKYNSDAAALKRKYS